MSKEQERARQERERELRGQQESWRGGGNKKKKKVECWSWILADWLVVVMCFSECYAYS